MNITSLNIKNTCTGCQVCAAVCPHDAILIKLNKHGFYEPEVNLEICTDCSICTKICYKYSEVEMSDFSLNHYAAFAKDERILKETTSGGIAYILSKYFIEQGYKCIGVQYDKNNDIASNAMAESLEEIEAFKGSKYIQSYTYDAFRDLVKKNINEKIAVFGTPCHIYALDMYLKLRKKRDNYILIDLYCHGCPSLFLWKKYLSEVKDIMHCNDFKNVNFRSKIKKWGAFHVEMVFSNKVFISNKKKNEFYDLFFSDYLLNDACHDCKLRSTLAYCDIRLGDFWGKCYVRNKKGVSIISAVTSRGQKVIDSIADQIDYVEHHFNDFISFQSYGDKYSCDPKLRAEMFEILENSDRKLIDVFSCFYDRQSLLYKTQYIAKKILNMLPSDFLRLIKLIYYKLRP